MLEWIGILEIALFFIIGNQSWELSAGLPSVTQIIGDSVEDRIFSFWRAFTVPSREVVLMKAS